MTVGGMLHTRNNDAEEKERSGEYAQRNPTTCARCDREGELGRAVYKSRSRLTTLRFLLLGRVVPAATVSSAPGHELVTADIETRLACTQSRPRDRPAAGGSRIRPSCSSAKKQSVPSVIRDRTHRQNRSDATYDSLEAPAASRGLFAGAAPFAVPCIRT
jgi:hypothetical protein